MAASGAVQKLRRDLGDVADKPAFSDAELATILEDAEGDQLAALVQGLWELTMNTARLNDYTVGLDTEKKSQVHAQFAARWEQRQAELVARSTGTSSGGTTSFGTLSIATVPVW